MTDLNHTPDADRFARRAALRLEELATWERQVRWAAEREWEIEMGSVCVRRLINPRHNCGVSCGEYLRHTSPAPLGPIYDHWEDHPRTLKRRNGRGRVVQYGALFQPYVTLDGATPPFLAADPAPYHDNTVAILIPGFGFGEKAKDRMPRIVQVSYMRPYGGADVGYVVDEEGTPLGSSGWSTSPRARA